MLEVFKTKENRKIGFIFLGLFAFFAILSAIVGISDNPPGIALAFLSTTSFILGFVHHWKTSKRFLYLLLGSFVGFIVTGFLHNVFEGIGSTMGNPILQGVFNVVGAALFLIAILLCPPGILIGAIGAIAMFIKRKLGKKEKGETVGS
jgi:hypothetical protein